MLDIPAYFFDISYKGSQYPGNPALQDIRYGANCQLFAYELLKHYGKPLPPFRSSELWEDSLHTEVVKGELLPLDVLLWNRTPEPFGAHVGLYIGEDKAIHLARREGLAVIWPLSRFGKEDLYRYYIGAKRVRRREI